MHRFHLTGIFLVLAVIVYIIGSVSSALAIPPSFRNATTATTGQTNSITIAKPLTITGDVMIAAITIRDPSAVVTVTPPVTGGWVHIRQTLQSGVLVQDLFYKVASASEPLNYVFTHNQSREAAGAIASYWQVDQTLPIDAHSGQFNSGSTPTAPSITTSVSDTTLVTIFGTRTGDDLSPPNATIERWRVAGTNGNQGYDETFSGPGATGVRTSSSNRSSTIGQMIALRPAVSITPGSAGTVLFVTTNASNTADLEQLRKDKLESWGYSIQLIDQGAAQAVYDAAIPLADVAYIPASVASNTHRDRLANACIGVVNEEGNLADDLGLSDTASKSSSETDISIATSSHYITQPFFLGSYPLFMTGQPLYSVNGTIASGASVLGFKPGEIGLVEDWASLFVIDSGGLLATGGPAPARRVHLPWGTSQTDLTEITANGDQLMKRSVDWAAQNKSCTSLSKAAFLTDGTPIIDGSSLPVGTKIHFLLYLDNSNTVAINDLNVSDTLDPAFQYTPVASGGVLKVDNSVNTGATEAAIYSAVSSNANLAEDLVNGILAAGYTPGTTTISAGSDAGNATLNIAANKIWAMLFEVTLQP